MQIEFAETIRDVFDAPDPARAEDRLKAAVGRYAETAPGLAAWMEQNLPEGLTVFAIPKGHRRMLRTSNWLENLNGKIRKRTAVVGLFPNLDSTLRLISAILRDTDERWLTGKRYLTITPQTND